MSDLTYKEKFNKKHGFSKDKSHSLKEISKITGVSEKGIQQIYNKGIGAYKTNPSSVRSSVNAKEQWAFARVYSAVTGGKASKVDAKELKMGLGGATNNNDMSQKIDFTDYYEKGGVLEAMPESMKKKLLNSKGERKIDLASIKMLTEYIDSLPQTKSMYLNENGKYTESRRKLHVDIIQKTKQDVQCVERKQPIAILMGGSPASGKSTFLKKYAPYLLKEELFKIDADEVRAQLPEYQGWNASQTHLETKDIVDTLLSDRVIGIPCRFDVIYDGTMNNVKKYFPLITLLKELGYKVFSVYVDGVPKKEIIRRNLNRYKTHGRFVPLEVIDDFFAKGKTALEQIKERVDGYIVVDGSNDYEIIEEGGFRLPKTRRYSALGRKPSEIEEVTEEVFDTENQVMAQGGIVFPEEGDLKFIKNLGGSTGAYLVESKKSGEQFVLKKGMNNEQATEEYYANKIYEILGIKVPKTKLFTQPDGRKYLLHDYIKDVDVANQVMTKKLAEEITKNYVADALLANWDIYQNDNILINKKDGKAYRVDNGGAMRFRARGARKTNFNGVVDELNTLKENNRIITQFLTDAEIKSQIKKVISKKDKVIDFIPESELKHIIRNRFKFLEDLSKKDTIKFKKGGQINFDPDDKIIQKLAVSQSGNTGGMLVGRRHSNDGIKAINKSTGQPLEMEGGEVVITRKAVSNPKKRMFNGQMLTNREILSKINSENGGVSFAEGGEVPDNFLVSKDISFEFGGETMCGCDIACKISKGENTLYEDMDDEIEDGLTQYEEGGSLESYSKNNVINYLEARIQGLREEYERKKNFLTNFEKGIKIRDINGFQNQLDLEYEKLKTPDQKMKEFISGLKMDFAYQYDEVDDSKVKEKAKTVIYSNQFKNWFGDWELAKETNSYLGVSKVVDDQGFPLLVYHGTDTQFTEWKTYNQNNLHYFSKDLDFAQFFASSWDQRGDNAGRASETIKNTNIFRGKFVYPTFISIKNPIDLSVFKVDKKPVGTFIKYLEVKYDIDFTFDVLGSPLRDLKTEVFAWQIIRFFQKFNKFIKNETPFDGFIFYEFHPEKSQTSIDNASLCFTTFNSDQNKFAEAKAFNPKILDSRLQLGGKL